MCGFDRVGHVSVERHDPGPQVPDERTAAWAQNTADLGKARGAWGPVVHRQRADDQVERSVGELERRHVADEERRPVPPAIPRTVGVRSSALDHGRIEVETGHV